MLPAKLLFATVSLGLVVMTTDVSGSRLRVRVHQKVTCPSGQQSIGVAGWSSDGCVTSGNVCVAETYGDCPSGAHCAWLDTGVYGCTDGAEESTPWEGCSDNEDTIGVVGWDHDGCIDSDNVCVAQVSNGDCPAGAYCSLLDTGVYGCVASAKKHHHHHKENQKVSCPSGQQSIGVAGWSSDGCVTSGNVCVAETYGDCPSGAHCAWLDTGVYGCTDGAEESTPWEGCSDNEDTIGVVGWDHDGCIDSDNVCVAQVSNGDCPAGAYCSLLDTGVYGCVASAKKHHHHHKENQKVSCPSGQQSIGVAGWSSDGCVTSGNVCVAETYGDCPSGAHCAWLDTGVYGCTDGAEESTPWEGCSDNEDTIGVVGWDHDGCIDSDNVCVAQVSNGDCPAGAYCSLLDTGVYGCVASAKKHHHHHKENQKVSCPSGQQSIGVAGWSSDGCVTSGNVCVAETYGDCPSGAHCAWLDTGVYGCTDGAEESTPWEGCSDNEDTIGVVGWDHDGCIDSDNVCVAQVSNGDCPAGAYCSLLDTGVYGCVASAKKHHHHHKENQKVSCPSGQQSIGVAGWSSDGCVTSGNVCVAETYGDCPSGAHCAWLDTGVYGCTDGAEESTPWEGCSDNEDTIGVVGWDHDGCIDSDNVCVAQVSNGDCPAGAYCSLLDTGVYGCVASSKH